MLEKIRKAGHTYIAKFFFIIIAISFAWSLGDMGGNTAQVIAVVGKHKILLNEFLQAKQEEINKLKRMQHLSPAEAQQYASRINSSALTNLVTKTLIHLEVEHLGIKVAPQAIAEYIQNDQSFYKDGEFDLDSYKQILANNNINEEKFVGLLSNEIASKFLLDVLTVNLPLKKKLSDYWYDYLAEKRLISLVSIDTNKLNISNIDEQILKNFYQKHQDHFKSKEYRSFSYLLLSLENSKKTINLSEEDLQKEYDENREEYALPETRDFYHYLVPNHELANKIIIAVKSGEDQAVIAKNFADQKVIGEEFVNQTANSFISSLDPSLFQLKEHEVTGGIKSELGWHVFKVIKIHPKQYKQFTEVKKQIIDKLQSKIAEKQLYELSKQVEDDISSGASFEEVTTRHNLPLATVKQVAADGSSSAGQKDDKISAEILNLAFSTAVNEESPMTNINHGQDYVLVKMEELIGPKLQEFAAVTKQVQDLYLVKFKDEIALEITRKVQSKAADVILTQVNSNKPIYKLDSHIIQSIQDEVMKNHKLTAHKDSIVISLQNFEVMRPLLVKNHELPEMFVEDLFYQNVKNSSAAQKLGFAKYGFAKVQQIIPISERDPELYKQVLTLSEINYKNEIQDQFIDYLRYKYPVKLHLELLQNNVEE